MVKSILKFSITGLSLGLLFVIIDRQKIFESIAEAELKWLFLMYSVFICVRVVQSCQLKLILQKVGVWVSAPRVFLASALSSLYALILPGDIIALGVKWGNLSAATGKRSLVFNAMLYNRLVILAPYLLIGSLALIWENPFPATIIAGSVIFSGVLIFLIILSLYSSRFGVLADRFFIWITKPTPAFFRGKIANLINSLQLFRGLAFSDHLIILAISLGSCGLSIIMFICGAKTMGLDISSFALIWIFSIIVLLRHLPITIGNLGVRESILIMTLIGYGIAPEKSFSFGLILFSNHILIALIGAGYQVSLNMGWLPWKLGNREC